MTLLVGIQEIVPPKIEGCQDVFSSANVLVAKPRWIADNQVRQCQGCDVPFTHFRRRHHCRHCGHVYCVKCCDQKTPLPYLGYIHSERVCVRCHDHAKLVEQAFSMQMNTKIVALEVLTIICKEKDQIKTVIEIGGVYALIHAARIHDEAIRRLVVNALHGLAGHASLHQFLTDSGAITAVCRILSETDEKCTQLLLDGVRVLILFCKSMNMKTEVLMAGAMEPLLHLCSSVFTSLAVLALHCISAIVESLDTHDTIVDNSERHTLTKIMALISNREEQVQELALKTLAHLSSGRDFHRQRIIQEDIFNGNCLTRILGSRPRNKQILCNAACLVANLASTQFMEGSFNDLQMALCRLVEDFPLSEDLLVHCARGIANFSQLPQNANHMLPYLPFLVRVLFASTCAAIRQHALRMCILLLRHCPDTVNILGGPGAMVMLNGLVSIPDVLVVMETEVEKVVPKISQLAPEATTWDAVNR